MRKLITHPIFKSSMLTIAFTAVVHISNYLYTLISVRFLSPHEYSDLALIVSFYSLMGVFSATLANTSLSLLSRHQHSEKYEQIKAQILHSSTVFIYIVLFFALFVLTPIIHFAFSVTSIPEIIIILTAGIFSIGSALLSVHFQLQKNFVINGLFGITAALLKLLFAGIFLYLGYKIFGVAIALFLSGCISFIAFYPRKVVASYKTLIIVRKNYLDSFVEFLRSHKRFIFKTLVSALVMSLCIVIDTLLAKKLLSLDSAAQYIGMATLAKLFFYTATALCVVIFPYLLNKHSETSKKILFHLFMATIFFAGLLTLTLAYLFPQQLIQLILGKAYTLEAYNFVYVVLVGITATFASILTNLASLLDAAHFNKNVIGAAVFGFVLFVIFRPSDIQSLGLCLSALFAFSSILLYNNCVKKHL